MKILLSKTKAYSIWIYILCIFVIFLPGCKSKITTEFILEKPTAEQEKNIGDYLDALEQRAENCGISISSKILEESGEIQINCKGGNPASIKNLLFKKNFDFKLMVMLDESIIWEFLHDMDLSTIDFDTSMYFGSRYDSISGYFKLEIDGTRMYPVFGNSLPSDTSYAKHLLDSLLKDDLGENYCVSRWGIPLPNDSIRLPLYLFKTDEQNPFEQNERFIEYANVEKSTFSGMPEIRIKFKSNYISSWSKMTGVHKGEIIALIINNRVYSTPMIHERIEGGLATISGMFDLDEAKIISGLLISDPLPFELKLVSMKYK